jgi:hypothetical protein
MTRATGLLPHQGGRGSPVGDRETFARWRGYVAGERELRRSEEEQIGFRMAHRLGHETIYATDVPASLDFEAVQPGAMSDPGIAAKLGGMQAVVVAGGDCAGADMVGGWFRRNLRIFSNLTRIVDSGEDRVFLILGQGHIPIFRDLAVDYPDFCLESPLPYLEGT